MLVEKRNVIHQQRAVGTQCERYAPHFVPNGTKAIGIINILPTFCP